MFRSFTIVNRHNRYLKISSPSSSIGLMNKRTHADETSTMNMEYDSFWCLMMVIFDVFCFEDVDSAHQKFGVLGNL